MKILVTGGGGFRGAILKQLTQAYLMLSDTLQRSHRPELTAQASFNT